MRPLQAIILAAGEGTRMKSDLPKVLHPICGRPMIAYTLDLAVSLGVQHPIVVLGHGAEAVKSHLPKEARAVLQTSRAGTGDAVLAAKKALSGTGGALLILYADTPLIRRTTLQRLVETLLAVPGIVLALVVLSVFGQSLANVMVGIGLVRTLEASRLVRNTVLAVQHNAYIEAARAAGASSWRLLLSHVLPNVLAPILIFGSVWLGKAMVMEAALSVLGFGIPPPTPTWGGMLSGEGRRSLTAAPYLVIFPGLALSVVVLACNLLGDAVRDLLDPRSRPH